MTRPKTMKPTNIRSTANGRTADFMTSDGMVVADKRGVYVEVVSCALLSVEELILALRSAKIYHLSLKEK